MRLAPATLLLATAATALALAAQPAAAATALGGELNIGTTAILQGKPAVVQTDHQGAVGLPGTLNVTATAVAQGVGDFHADSVTTFGTAQATWASANAGSVQFTNYGWNFNVPVASDQLDSQAYLDMNRPGNDWSYSFTATGDGLLQMSYNVTASGAAFGLFGWSIGLIGGSGSGGPDLTQPQFFNDPTTSGLYTAAVTAGQTYTVFLDNNGNVSQSGVAQFAGAMDGSFDWQITEGVPEPASRALMLLGFGGLGAALRRRRGLAAAVSCG